MKSRGSSSIMYWDNDCLHYRKARLVFNVSLMDCPRVSPLALNERGNKLINSLKLA